MRLFYEYSLHSLEEPTSKELDDLLNGLDLEKAKKIKELFEKKIKKFNSFSIYITKNPT